jgi:hypothetical protein
MDNRGIRYEKDFPPPLPEAHAPVQIFAVQKITFIPEPNIFDCFATYQHECAGNSLHLQRIFWKRLLVEVKIKKKSGPIASQPVQSKRPDK